MTITLPGSITLQSGANTLTVDAFTSSPDGGTTLNGGGEASFKVGATLHLGAHQPPGRYRGSFTVTVAYD